MRCRSTGPIGPAALIPNRPVPKAVLTRLRSRRAARGSRRSRCCTPCSALAVILPATTIDGPSESIVGFGGVGDGRRRQRRGGVPRSASKASPHVFVSRYVEGHWLAPIRVDTEEPFAASWPRIGAAEGGELIVVWATPFATTATASPSYELLGAELGPGAERFGPAIDRRPGHRRSDRHQPRPRGQLDRPGRRRLPGGRALVTSVRRCCGPATSSSRSASRTSTAERWSNLGAINRDPGVSMRPPTQANAPQDRDRPHRQRGRRRGRSPTSKASRASGPGGSSGSSLDYVMPVTAESFNGAPITTTPTRRASPSRGSVRPRSPTARAAGRSARRCRGRASS